MTTESQRYCPQCNNIVEPFHGQKELYHCYVCEMSVNREETLNDMESARVINQRFIDWDESRGRK